MSEAHAENRRRLPQPTNELDGNPGLIRRARPGRDDDVARRHGHDVFHGQRVRSLDNGSFAQLANVAREVVHERIEVVDHEDHVDVTRASMMPRALWNVSWYSCSASESATIPPPAFKYTRPSLASAVRMAMFVSSSPVTLR